MPTKSMASKRGGGGGGGGEKAMACEGGYSK